MRVLLVSAVFMFDIVAHAQSHFPPPPAPADNPITETKALLGMALFWDEQLSSNNTVACGTCHAFRAGGGDARARGLSPGGDGAFGTADDVQGSFGVPRRTAAGSYLASAFGTGRQVTRRRAPAVVNLAWTTALFYDGRAVAGPFVDQVTGYVVVDSGALENLALRPLLDPAEMGHEGRRAIDVADKVAGARALALADRIPTRLALFATGQGYAQLFESVFGSPGVTPDRIAKALATYLRTLVADESRFDWHLANMATMGPIGSLLSNYEQSGLAVFNAHCVSCHADISARAHIGGPHAAFGVVPPPQPHYYSPPAILANTLPNTLFRYTGVAPVAHDAGAGQGRMRALPLRNVGLHLDWFHDGSATSLADVVAFYSRGSVQPGGLAAMNLTATEQDQLIAFLMTLTDPRVAAEQAPFDRPRLHSERGDLTPQRFGLGMQDGPGAAATAIGVDPTFLGNPACTIAVRDGRAGLPAFALWSADRLPAGIDFAGLRLFADPAHVQVVAAGATQGGNGVAIASQTFAIPRVSALGGMHAAVQWLLVDPALPTFARTSDALWLTLR